MSAVKKLPQKNGDQPPPQESPTPRRIKLAQAQESFCVEPTCCIHVSSLSLAKNCGLFLSVCTQLRGQTEMFWIKWTRNFLTIFALEERKTLKMRTTLFCCCKRMSCLSRSLEGRKSVAAFDVSETFRCESLCWWSRQRNMEGFMSTFGSAQLMKATKGAGGQFCPVIKRTQTSASIYSGQWPCKTFLGNLFPTHKDQRALYWDCCDVLIMLDAVPSQGIFTHSSVPCVPRAVTPNIQFLTQPFCLKDIVFFRGWRNWTKPLSSPVKKSKDSQNFFVSFYSWKSQWTLLETLKISSKTPCCNSREGALCMETSQQPFR